MNKELLRSLHSHCALCAKAADDIWKPDYDLITELVEQRPPAWQGWLREAAIRCVFWAVGLLIGYLYWSGPLR